MGNRVTVAVTGHFQLLTPLLMPFFGGTQNLAFTRSSTMQIETLPVPPVTTTTTTLDELHDHVDARPQRRRRRSTSTTTTTTTSVNCNLPSAGFTFTTSP